MKIIFLGHPDFLNHQSMGRYLKMLSDGMRNKGHKTDVWVPKANLVKLSDKPFLRKWFGYIDQYIIFPVVLFYRVHLKINPSEYIFVFTDQALGPWVPIVKKYKHVIHCHDFLALRSSLGEIPENPIGASGKIYQKYIRKGFSKGINFISVSKKTQVELHTYYLGKKILHSHVVYNGLNQPFAPLDKKQCVFQMEGYIGIEMKQGYVLHVGGNHWYKNRLGVVLLYAQWCKTYGRRIPLLLVGQKADEALTQAIEESGCKELIHVLVNLPDTLLNVAYSGSNLLLFPSLEEGFGWPIAEAMAAGTLILTTNEAPMTEVGGDSAFYINRMPADISLKKKWKEESAARLELVMNISGDERASKIQKGFEQVKKFTTATNLSQIELIYQKL